MKNWNFYIDKEMFVIYVSKYFTNTLQFIIITLSLLLTLRMSTSKRTQTLITDWRTYPKLKHQHYIHKLAYVWHTIEWIKMQSILWRFIWMLTYLRFVAVKQTIITNLVGIRQINFKQRKKTGIFSKQKYK